MNDSIQNEKSYLQGRLYFILLLLGIFLLAGTENSLIYFLSAHPRGDNAIPFIYPVELSLITLAGMVSGILLLMGFRIRYLFLMVMMILSILLAFFSVQVFQISYGLGYMIIAGCILLLGSGFYAFYNADIVFFLKQKADGRKGTDN